ncbi:pyrroloquinoline quinone biosynthesis protein PqqB [Chitinophagaceae bacterium IBVUCB1]|nr:pyrroloquinoline quinone biosynthesis protein PqqB [Chitinophagaceae bacterium IBVUCB1]
MQLLRNLIWVCFALIASNSYAQNPYMIVLGTVQDGGYPHIGCKKTCCEKAWKRTDKQYIVSLALVDSQSRKWWLFEATPDIKEQLQYFKTITNGRYNYLPDGIFITHAHIGHYTGLMQLGREALGAKAVTVYSMPVLKNYFETNGPWSQLVKLQNISVYALQNGKHVIPASGISVTPYIVPHRDEYSETVGFKITTNTTSYLFIPDIDKWQKWDKQIIDEVKAVDFAFIDATFYNEAELPGKRMEEVPHPFVSETMQLFTNEADYVKSKIHFIHINHTNPLLWRKPAEDSVRKQGFNIAKQGNTYK